MPKTVVRIAADQARWRWRRRRPAGVRDRPLGACAAGAGRRRGRRASRRAARSPPRVRGPSAPRRSSARVV